MVLLFSRPRVSPVAVRFRVVDAPVVQVVLAMPIVVNDRYAGSDFQIPVEVPQKQYSDKVVDVPVVQVVVVPQVQFCVAVDVPVMVERCLVANSEVPQIHFIAGVQDIPVVSQRQVPTVLSFSW